MLDLRMKMVRCYVFPVIDTIWFRRLDVRCWTKKHKKLGAFETWVSRLLRKIGWTGSQTGKLDSGQNDQGNGDHIYHQEEKTNGVSGIHFSPSQLWVATAMEDHNNIRSQKRRVGKRRIDSICRISNNLIQSR